MSSSLSSSLLSFLPAVYSMETPIPIAMSEFLDTHLILPIIEFLQTCKVFDACQLDETLRTLAAQTGLFALRERCGEDVNSERKAMEESRSQLESICRPVLDIARDSSRFDDTQRGSGSSQIRVPDDVQVNCQALYDLSKLLFEIGNYSESRFVASVFRSVCPSDSALQYQSLWGSFAALLLTQLTDSSSPLPIQNFLSEIDAFRSQMEAKDLPLTVAMDHRLWFLHYALFAYFSSIEMMGPSLDLYLYERNLETMHMRAPYLLRYVVVSFILTRRKKFLDRICRTIRLFRYLFHDPITELFESLYIDFDFDAAQALLEPACKACSEDFFLSKYSSEFFSSAQSLIFEVYCQIHQSIDLNVLTEKLKLEDDNAEKWLVNLIRNTHLDAKIDSEHNLLTMRKTYPSPYQNVIDKTKGVVFRSQILASNVEKAEHRILNQLRSVAASMEVGDSAA